MVELIDAIKQLTEEIQVDLDKFQKGNKAAGRRVRVNSIKLADLYKQFRKESVKE